MRIPKNPDELTVEWLNDAFFQTGRIQSPCIRSINKKILGGTQGALGQLARVEIEYENADIAGPRSLVAKFATANSFMHTILTNARVYEREVRFYEALADKIDLHTPDCYYSDINLETGYFVLLLEDMTYARSGKRADDCALPEAELAIREIAKVHAAFWENMSLSEISWIAAHPLSYHAWQNSYQSCWPIFVEKLDEQLPDEILKIGQKFGPTVSKVLEYGHNPPRTLIHDDYMFDNFFFHTVNGQLNLTVIDWQFLTYAKAVRDVASLLGSNMSPGKRRSCEMALLQTYHHILVDLGVSDYTFDQCWYDYRFAMLDGLLRMVCAIGGGTMNKEQEKVHIDIYWPRFCTAILDLNAGELLSI